MKTIALYDGTCSLCKETKKIFKKLDWLNRVEWISLQEYEKRPGSFSFSRQDLRRELHIITPSGSVKKGYSAIRRLLFLFPASFLMSLLLYLPLTPMLGDPIYKWIAKNRHKFLKKKCDDGSCSL
jgi:predicted DCC family thiol-disulfide oxidoreductase YuxK